jgi:hypothetical protein
MPDCNSGKAGDDIAVLVHALKTAAALPEESGVKQLVEELRTMN